MPKPMTPCRCYAIVDVQGRITFVDIYIDSSRCVLPNMSGAGPIMNIVAWMPIPAYVAFQQREGLAPKEDK
jgi:hypothetical protein